MIMYLRSILLGLSVLASATFAQDLPVDTVGGSITGHQTWYADSVYLVTVDITIGTDDTLTIEGEAVVKFYACTGCEVRRWLRANGVLNLESTPGNPIYFTSSRDDSLGGDSNNDSTATSPAPGNWHCVVLENDLSEIHDCVFKYGGHSYASYHSSMLDLTIGTPVVWDCEFRYSSSCGLNSYRGDGSPEIRINTFEGCGIEYTGVGSPLVHDNTSDGEGGECGIKLDGSFAGSVIDSDNVSGYSTGIDLGRCSTQVHDNVITLCTSSGYRRKGQAAANVTFELHHKGRNPLSHIQQTLQLDR